MAQKTIVELIDDVDGSKADETIRFALDGVEYEIDLNAENSEKLRNAVSEWVGHARRSSGRKTPAKRGSSGTGGGAGAKHDVSAIRDWARANGYEVSDRGRISSSVLKAYEAAS